VVKAFTEEEVARFFEAAKMPLPHGALFWTLALTGLRVGEALALKWSDVDLAHGVVHVKRSRNRKGFVSTPKSGERLVRLSNRASRMLQRLQMLRAERARRQRWKTPPDEIFVTSRGTPPNRWAVREAFIDVLERAGLPKHHTPHSLRHTYASLLLKNGEPVQYVQQQLGHKTIALTVDLYGRWAKAEPQHGGANYLDTFTQTGNRTGSNEGLTSRKSAQIVAIRAKATQIPSWSGGR
jgi:integrase